MNIALCFLTVAALLSSVYVIFRPGRTLPVFFVWVGIADLGKRLLWLPQDATPTFFEYSFALLLPDLVLMAGAGRLILDYLRGRKHVYRYHPLDLPVALFFIWSLINVFHPGNSLFAGLAGFKSFQLYVLVYVAVRLYPGSISEFLQDLKYPILGISLVAVLYGLYQIQFGFTDFEARWLSSGVSKLASDFSTGGMSGKYGETIAMHNIVRVFSTFASHEQFGFFLGFVAILLFALLDSHKFQYVALAILCMLMMRTLSRSSWIFTLSAASFLVVANYVSRNNARSLFSLMLIIWMSFGYFFWNYYTKWQSRPEETQVAQAEITENEQPASSGKRFNKLKEPFRKLKRLHTSGSPDEMAPEHAYAERAFTLGTYEWRIFTYKSLIVDPDWHRVFGNGTGSMWYAWRIGVPGTKIPRKTEILAMGLPVPGKRVLSHVGTVDIVYELGILGLALFMWLVIVGILSSYRFLHESNSKKEKAIVATGLALFLGFIVANTTVATILIFRPISAPFWLSLALVATEATKIKRITTQRELNL